jgi:hypothetical protein
MELNSGHDTMFDFRASPVLTYPPFGYYQKIVINSRIKTKRTASPNVVHAESGQKRPMTRFKR